MLGLILEMCKSRYPYPPIRRADLGTLKVLLSSTFCNIQRKKHLSPDKPDTEKLEKVAVALFVENFVLVGHHLDCIEVGEDLEQT